MANGSQAMLAQAHNSALVIDRETKLGMTPGGQVMSKFNQEVATSGSKAFAPAHEVQGRFVSRSRTASNGKRFTTHEPGSHATLVSALRALVGRVRADWSRPSR